MNLLCNDVQRLTQKTTFLYGLKLSRMSKSKIIWWNVQGSSWKEMKINSRNWFVLKICISRVWLNQLQPYTYYLWIYNFFPMYYVFMCRCICRLHSTIIVSNYYFNPIRLPQDQWYIINGEYNFYYNKQNCNNISINSI